MSDYNNSACILSLLIVLEIFLSSLQKNQKHLVLQGPRGISGTTNACATSKSKKKDMPMEMTKNKQVGTMRKKIK